MNQTTYMRIGEFSKRIGKDPSTVRRWDRIGILRPAYVTPGGERMYTSEQVDQVLSNKDRPRPTPVEPEDHVD